MATFENPQVGQVILQAAQGLSSVFQRQTQLVARQREREENQRLALDNAKAKGDQQKIENDRLQSQLEISQAAEARRTEAAPFQQKKIEAEAKLAEAKAKNIVSGAPNVSITDLIRRKAFARNAQLFFQERGGDPAFAKGLGFGDQEITIPGTTDKVTVAVSPDMIFDSDRLNSTRKTAQAEINEILGDITNRQQAAKEGDDSPRRKTLLNQLQGLEQQRLQAQAGLNLLGVIVKEMGVIESMTRGLEGDPVSQASARQMRAAEEANTKFFEVSKLVSAPSQGQFVLDIQAKNVASISKVLKTRFPKLTRSVETGEEWVAFVELVRQTLGSEDGRKFLLSVADQINGKK